MPVGCGQTVTSEMGGRVTVEVGVVVRVVVISNVVVTIVSFAAIWRPTWIWRALAAEPSAATARSVLEECISYTVAR